MSAIGSRHPQEVVDSLMKDVPRVVKSIEKMTGLRAVDFLTRRQLPECRRAIARLVRELNYVVEWDEKRIARALDTSVEAVAHALRTPEAP